MTIKIPLSPDTEARLRERAAEAGKDPATYAREALEEKLAASEEKATIAVSMAAGQRIEEFLDWVTSHRPINHPVDDSRESIYEGRGE